MDASAVIRQCVAQVSDLRQIHEQNTGLAEALFAVKKFQARRFEVCYEDILDDDVLGNAARFFLTELYGARDFSGRDTQFARISKALQTLFPAPVVQLAVQLAKLHALTEELDHTMALNWFSLAPYSMGHIQRYCMSWQSVGRKPDRALQLDTVVHIGEELARLTQMRGLRTMLRLMRGPAHAAGLADLQAFLELGFGTFSELSRNPAKTHYFLSTIDHRERNLIHAMFGAPSIPKKDDIKEFVETNIRT